MEWLAEPRLELERWQVVPQPRCVQGNIQRRGVGILYMLGAVGHRQIQVANAPQNMPVNARNLCLPGPAPGLHPASLGGVKIA
jgi:hypothetical protein